MLILDYCKEGMPHSDFDLEYQVIQLQQWSKGDVWKVSTENIWLMALALRNEGKIKDLELRADGKAVEFTNEGDVLYPRGWIDVPFENTVRLNQSKMKYLVGGK